MLVQHNMTAHNSNRMLGVTTSQQAKSSEKLSSGYQINRAADDAAGLSISEKMRRQVRGLTQATKNAQDGISAVQTAEGALNEVQDMLQRMNELTVKAANGTLQTVDRTYIQNEVDALVSEIDRVSASTTFNEQNLLNGEFTGKCLQVGSENPLDNSGAVNMASRQVIKISINKVDFKGLTAGTLAFKSAIDKDVKLSTKATGTLQSVAGGAKIPSATSAGVSKLTVSTQSTAQSSISFIKTALQNVSTQRSALGAIQNRLEHTIANLNNVVENTTSAESLIRDTDMASEMVRYSNNNILAQAGQSMLAQANQSNQGVLSLLG
jgi:flagellin